MRRRGYDNAGNRRHGRPEAQLSRDLAAGAVTNTAGPKLAPRGRRDRLRSQPGSPSARSAASKAAFLFVSSIVFGMFVLSFRAGRLTAYVRPLAEGEFAEVERDEERLGDLLHVLVVGVDAPPGRHLDALELAIVEDVVRAARPS